MLNKRNIDFGLKELCCSYTSWLQIDRNVKAILIGQFSATILMHRYRDSSI